MERIKRSDWIIDTSNANSVTFKPKLPSVDENSFVKSLTWARPELNPEFFILDLKANCTDKEIISGAESEFTESIKVDMETGDCLE